MYYVLNSLVSFGGQNDKLVMDIGVYNPKPVARTGQCDTPLERSLTPSHCVIGVEEGVLTPPESKGRLGNVDQSSKFDPQYLLPQGVWGQF